MKQTDLQRAAENQKLMNSAMCTLAVCLFAMSSCGRVNMFTAKSGSTTSAPVTETTVLPPVPVTGSYLTSILMDEFSKPIARADVLADAGQFFARTNEVGVVALPVRLIKDSTVALDVKANGQTVFINVQLPIDIAEALRSVDPAAGTELPRAMGIRIANSQIPPVNAPSNRVAVETLSLPSQIVQSLAANTPALPFAITSHKNGDVVQSFVRLTGSCDAGFPIRVTGDLVVMLDTLCLSSGSRGIFDATVKLTQPDGLKSVTVTQTHPSNGEYVSRLLLLNSVNSPVAPSLTAANISGLKPILTGTCDSSATSHTATTTLGSVRSVSCANNILSVLVHLPAGSADFNVTVTSTKDGVNISSSAVPFTRTAFTCPAGYVGVPGSGVAGLGNASATNGNTSWWLDTNKDFCVMKYPAKDNGGSVAVSKTTGFPWVNIGNSAASSACQSAGARLISNTQWQTVARNAENVAENWSGGSVGQGAMAQGHNDNNPPNTLDNNASDSEPYYGTGNSAVQAVGTGWEQKRTHQLSNGEIVWDFSGNIWQWVSDSLLPSPAPSGSAWNWIEFSDTSAFPASTTATNRLLLAPLGFFGSAQRIGRVYWANNPSPVTFVRGCNWNCPDMAGLFSVSTFISSGNHVGFRCTSLPP